MRQIKKRVVPDLFVRFGFVGRVDVFECQFGVNARLEVRCLKFPSCSFLDDYPISLSVLLNSRS